jgi:transposase
MTTADQHRIMLRQAEAVRLRVRGYSYQMIADAIGVSKKQAFDDVKANLAASAKERNGDTEEARELELLRLDNAITRVTKILESEVGFSVEGMSPEDLAELVQDASDLVLKAADRLVKLSSERSKLLGLYAAEKRDLNAYITGEVTPEAAAELVRKKFGQHGSMKES